MPTPATYAGNQAAYAGNQAETTGDRRRPPETRRRRAETRQRKPGRVHTGDRRQHAEVEELNGRADAVEGDSRWLAPNDGRVSAVGDETPGAPW